MASVVCQIKQVWILDEISDLMGHIVSDQGVEVDPRKTEAVKNWPKPLTHIDIRSFLGLDSYYRKFVEGFSSIATSLTAFTKKKAKF